VILCITIVSTRIAGGLLFGQLHAAQLSKQAKAYLQSSWGESKETSPRLKKELADLFEEQQVP